MAEAAVKEMTQDWLNPVNPMYPDWPAADTLVIKVAIPENAIWGDFAVSWGEHNSPPTSRRVTLSNTPNDFRKQDKTGVNGPFAGGQGTSGSVGAKLSASPPLAAGATYYVNFRNEVKFDGEWEQSTEAATAPMVVGWTFPT